MSPDTYVFVYFSMVSLREWKKLGKRELQAY